MAKFVKYAALVCAVLAAGLVTVEVRGEDFDCSSYNPQICTADAILFCLTNGTIITGRCHAMRAVCVEKKALDATFAACGHQSNSQFDCDRYNANPLVCTKDSIPFCLANGTVVRGSCNAKRAVCKENQRVVDDFSPCNKAGANPASRDNDGGNSASSVYATISLLLSPLLAAFFF